VYPQQVKNIAIVCSYYIIQSQFPTLSAVFFLTKDNVEILFVNFAPIKNFASEDAELAIVNLSMWLLDL